VELFSKNLHAAKMLCPVTRTWTSRIFPNTGSRLHRKFSQSAKAWFQSSVGVGINALLGSIWYFDIAEARTFSPRRPFTQSRTCQCENSL